MDVTGGNVAHVVTDDGEHVRVDRVDSVYIHPREDRGDVVDDSDTVADTSVDLEAVGITVSTESTGTPV